MNKRIIAGVLTLSMSFGLLFTTIASAAFYERTSAPSITNKAYYDVNCNPFYTKNLWSWCTWYTYGRAYEILGTNPNLSTSSAKVWYPYNKEKGYHPYSDKYNEAKQGAVICYENRVAMVESVNDDGTPRFISGTGTSTRYTDKFETLNWNASRPFYFGEPWSTNDFVGYIYLLDNSSEASTPSVTPTEEDNKTSTGYVTSPTALNVREGAGKEYAAIGSLPSNATVAIYPSKSVNGWYYIKYGTLEGYVSGKYISLV